MFRVGVLLLQYGSCRGIQLNSGEERGSGGRWGGVIDFVVDLTTLVLNCLLCKGFITRMFNPSSHPAPTITGTSKISFVILPD